MAIKLLLSLCLFATLAAIVPAPPVDKEQDLRDFLIKYGYLDGESTSKKAFRKAIRDFQRTYGLEETGEYSESLEKLIKRDRCGNPDKVKPGTELSNYVLYAPWSKITLKYRFIRNLRARIDLTESQVKTTVAEAFKLWADAVSGRLQFAEAGRKEEYDVSIGFYKKKHGDSVPFDGPRGVLAHAFFPENGQMHFDASEQWSGNYVDGINLELMSVHEIGHVLGLNHSGSKNSVMYAYHIPPSGPVSLHQDDIDGINALYPPPA